MFSKYGRIFSIDVIASQQSPITRRKYWIGIFRTLVSPAEIQTADEMRVQHHNITSRASVARVRRAQDRLMEGKHESD